MNRGMKEGVEALFSGIDWGTDKVLEQTRSHLHSMGLSWKELRPLRDIDDAADLEYLGAEFSL